MTTQQTLSIVKPDAIKAQNFGQIEALIEKNNLKIVACKMLQLSNQQAEAFYQEHKERPFYGSLVSFMTSGPVVVQVLEGEDAIARYRTLMGATNFADAEEGTIRALFATSIEANAVHGSDSPASAQREIAFFFPAE